MRMSFGQEMRMAQKQVLAPRMIQSMEILQLPMMALEERIEQEIQNTETLEVEEAEGESAAGESGAASAEAPPGMGEQRTVDEKPLVVDQDLGDLRVEGELPADFPLPGPLDPAPWAASRAGGTGRQVFPRGTR